jgi:prolyl-tRNA synthetase
MVLLFNNNDTYNFSFFLKTSLSNSAEPQDARAPSAGAKSLAIPFDQSRWTPIEPGKTKCPACGKDAKRWTMFGRSY